MKASEALRRLSEDGWSLEEQAAAAYLESECGDAPAFQQALQALLDADLAQVGAAALPSDVNRAHSKKLAGPLVLQVSAAADVSQPSRASGDAERKGRLLRLKLTDGRASCVGVELQPLPFSMEQLCPGTKVRLRGAAVHCGVVLLEPRCLELLGGRVAPLAEAWETQQKYGGATLERTDAEADKPPAFRHFDPKLSKYGSRRGQVASKAAAAAGSTAAHTEAVAPAGPGTAGAGAGAQAAQQQPQQQRRAARAGFQPYQPPVARTPQQQQHGQQAAQEAPAQQAAPPSRQQQQLQQQGHNRHGQGGDKQRERRLGGAPAEAPLTAPAPTHAAPAAGTAAQQPGQPSQQQQQQQQQQQSAAAQKLLGRLQAEEGRFGRGPRRGRRSRFDDDADDGSMTLEEWEAKQAAARAGAAPLSQQQLSDEELARQLQRQLDLEAAQERAAQAQAPADIAASLQNMFTYGSGDAGRGDGGRAGRGRGRGRRGGGGGGPGRGRGRR